MNIVNKIKQTVKRSDLISPGDKVIIGVSGGPDSLALLYIMNSIKNELGLTLYIAHLNHMIRKQSKADLHFVKNASKKLNLKFVSDEVNVAKLAKKGSIEEVAREARLKFFFKAAKKFKASKIALGHTRDDQAETVLMRILRGSGLCGLRGIVPKRNINGFTIIRPLIDLDRKQIDRFLKKIKVRPQIDSSNLQDIYFRNKLRNRLIPLLQKDYNSNIKEILTSMAENVGLDYEYLYDVSSSLLNEVSSKCKGSKITISLVKFRRCHPALQRMIVRLSIQEISGSTRRLNFKHWKELEDLVYRRPSGSVVDLPRQIKAQKDRGQISISLRKT